MSAHRPKFWRLLFKKQPIERGVQDPVEDHLIAAHSEVAQATNDMRAAMRAFLEVIEKRQQERRPADAPPHSK